MVLVLSTRDESGAVLQGPSLWMYLTRIENTLNIPASTIRTDQSITVVKAGSMTTSMNIDAVNPLS